MLCSIVKVFYWWNFCGRTRIINSFWVGIRIDPSGSRLTTLWLHPHVVIPHDHDSPPSGFTLMWWSLMITTHHTLASPSCGDPSWSRLTTLWLHLHVVIPHDHDSPHSGFTFMWWSLRIMTHHPLASPSCGDPRDHDTRPSGFTLVWWSMWSLNINLTDCLTHLVVNSYD